MQVTPMSFVTFSVKHGRTLDQARTELRSVVQQVQSRFGGMISRVDWSPDGSGVKLFGAGFDIDLRVDAEAAHVSGNLLFLGGLLSGPLVGGLKQIVQKTFAKRLT